MDAIIRDYRDEDGELIVELWMKAFPEIGSRNHFRDVIWNKQRFQPGLFVVADRDGAIEGTAIGGFDGIRGWIYWVAVAKGARRKSLGSRLVREIQTRLKAQGAIRIGLQTHDTRDDLKAFYMSLGYELEPRLSYSKVV